MCIKNEIFCVTLAVWCTLFPSNALDWDQLAQLCYMPKKKKVTKSVVELSSQEAECKEVLERILKQCCDLDSRFYLSEAGNVQFQYMWSFTVRLNPAVQQWHCKGLNLRRLSGHRKSELNLKKWKWSRGNPNICCSAHMNFFFIATSLRSSTTFMLWTRVSKVGKMSPLCQGCVFFAISMIIH